LRSLADGWLSSIIRYFDNEHRALHRQGRGVDWRLVWPFIGVHLACLAVIWVGWSWTAVLTALGLYLLRMFAITAFYHRYFSHRCFRTSRPMQFLFAILGNSAVQRGPLWWAAHHREHHAYSDTAADPHSPKQVGFWQAHFGWFLRQEAFATRTKRVQDWRRFPELYWLDRFDLLVPLALAFLLFATGVWLEVAAPALQTNRWQMLVWGFFVSTAVLYHATYTINSVAHVLGSRRFDTNDDSRNNWLLAVITLGEGWHNNHHYYPNSARQGFRWWEIDISYYGLRLLAAVGLVWDLKQIPDQSIAKRS